MISAIKFVLAMANVLGEVEILKTLSVMKALEYFDHVFESEMNFSDFPVKSI